MDTVLFRYVLTVAECGSITTAARRLFISQPALTKQIGKLEQELGTKLFDRKKTPITITPEGQMFLDFAAEYMEAEKHFVDRLNELQPEKTEHVRIASTPRGGDYAGNHTAAFVNKYPNIIPEYLDMNCVVCEESLLNETVDLAIYTDPVLSDHIEYMPVEEDPLVLAVPWQSPALEGLVIGENSPQAPLELEADCFRRPGVTFVLSTPNHSLYYAECEFLKRCRINLNNPLRVDYVDTRYAIALGGGGIMLTPLRTPKRIEGAGKIIFCTIRGERLSRYIILARKKGRTLPRAAELYWKYFVEQRFHS